ncbi:hypothetical protein LAZ67_X001826 [Cordylochernes scorpioides]|uniref:Mos1 transposase HTH domain-containing protein n=1 Tax=Cordylochernes scorpioides TaxID=51811 RepID=A0ABY6LXQ6_9ARAC|nr:hypothetical protein LAZ67_X001826 [Cordylochernes scorpioides]
MKAPHEIIEIKYTNMKKNNLKKKRKMRIENYKSNLTSKDSHERLMKALGDKALSIRKVFNWFNEFKFGKTRLEDEPRSGRPPTAVTQEKIKLVRYLPREDRRIKNQQLE